MGRNPLKPEQKKKIISLWPTHSYRQIHAKTGIAASAAHGAMEEWLGDLDAPTAEAIRQFMAEVQKSKLKKMSDLAHAYRIHNLTKSMNVDDIEIEPFLSELNDKCISRNIKPAQIARLLEQVVEFSRNQNVPLGKAPDLIKKLQKELAGIRNETATAKAARDKALADAKVTSDIIKEYLHLRGCLMYFGLPTNEPQKLVTTLQNVRTLGHDPKKIVEMFSKIKSFAEVEKQHQLNCEKWEKKAKSFKKTYELARWFKTIGFTPADVDLLADIFEDVAKMERIPIEKANVRVLVYLRWYANRDVLRKVPFLQGQMDSLRQNILFDLYNRFGMLKTLDIVKAMKRIVAEDYNWDVNALSQDLNELRQWRETKRQEQERQKPTLPLSSLPHDQLGEEVSRNTPVSTPKASSAPVESTVHGNEEQHGSHEGEELNKEKEREKDMNQDEKEALSSDMTENPFAKYEDVLRDYGSRLGTSDRGSQLAKSRNQQDSSGNDSSHQNNP